MVFTFIYFSRHARYVTRAILLNSRAHITSHNCVWTQYSLRYIVLFQWTARSLLILIITLRIKNIPK